VVERQESDDGTTWIGEWTERVRTDATMWLDLLLTYTKFYRYRIKAFTQTGTEGATSTPTADSIAPSKAGTNDIVAYAITADLIAANSVYTNALQAGAVIADKIASNAITTIKIQADAVTAGKINVTTLDAISANVGTLNAGIIDGVQFRIGGHATNKNIYFKSSGMYIYDGSGQCVYLAKNGYKTLSLGVATTVVAVGCVFGSQIAFYEYDLKVALLSRDFTFYNTGKLKFPVLTAGAGAGPAGQKGDIAFRDYGDKCRLMIHDGTEWRYITNTSSDW